MCDPWKGSVVLEVSLHPFMTNHDLIVQSMQRSDGRGSKATIVAVFVSPRLLPDCPHPSSAHIGAKINHPSWNWAQALVTFTPARGKHSVLNPILGLLSSAVKTGRSLKMDETMRSRPVVSLLCYVGWSSPCAFSLSWSLQVFWLRESKPFIMTGLLVYWCKQSHQIWCLLVFSLKCKFSLCVCYRLFLKQVKWTSSWLTDLSALEWR